MTIIRSAALIMSAALLFAASIARAGTWEEDFSVDGEYPPNWAIYNYDPSIEGWSQEDGVLKGWIAFTGYYSWLFLHPEEANPLGWTNYEVNVRARWTEFIDEFSDHEDDAPQFGITVYDAQMARGNPRYWLGIKVKGGEAAISRPLAEDGDVEDMERLAVSQPFQAERSVWIQLRASVTSTEISETVQFQVNDMPPVTLESDDPYRSGSLALYVRGISAEFDDFSATGDDIPNHAAGGASVSPAGKASVAWGRLKRSD